MRNAWTKEQEDKLCLEVSNTSGLLDQLKKSGQKREAYWTGVAARLWPEIKVTGEACRARYYECKDRYYSEMREHFEQQERDAANADLHAEVKAQLAEFDDGWQKTLTKIREIDEDYVHFIATTVFDMGVIVEALAKEWGLDVDKLLYEARGEDK